MTSLFFNQLKVSRTARSYQNLLHSREHASRSHGPGGGISVMFVYIVYSIHEVEFALIT